MDPITKIIIDNLCRMLLLLAVSLFIGNVFGFYNTRAEAISEGGETFRNLFINSTFSFFISVFCILLAMCLKM